MKRKLWSISLVVVMGLMLFSCGIGGNEEEKQSSKEKCIEEPGRAEGLIGFIDLRGSMYFTWDVTPGVIEGYWISKATYNTPDQVYTFVLTNEALIFGFEREVFYNVYISAVNRCGQGEWSEVYIFEYP